MTEQVTQRRAEYESKILTQKSLVELGQAIAKQERIAETNEEKYAYLLTTYKELTDFNNIRFISEYEKCNDPELRIAKIYVILNYVALLKELHECELFIINQNEKKIAGLKEDLATSEEQSESYITQLDEADSKRETLTKIIMTQDAEHTKLLKSYNASIQDLSNANINNKTLRENIWYYKSFIIILIALWLFKFFKF